MAAGKTTGVVAIGVATVGGIAALLSSAVPEVPGLAVIAVSGAKHGQGMSLTAPDAVLKYGKPGPDDLVRRCLIAGCDWNDANMYWSKFVNLRSDEAADTCQTPLKVDTPVPNPWTPEADLCKSWKAVLRTAIPNTVEKAPANGSWVTWSEVTTNSDSTPVTGTLQYRVYRGVKKDNSLDAATAKFVVETSNINALIKKQPVGNQCYAVTAKNASGESVMSGAACKLMKVPAPSDGKIEGPTDGAIEIK